MLNRSDDESIADTSINISDLPSPTSRSYSYQPLLDNTDPHSSSENREHDKSPEQLSPIEEKLIIETQGTATITLQRHNNLVAVHSPLPTKVTYIRSPQITGHTPHNSKVEVIHIAGEVADEKSLHLIEMPESRRESLDSVEQLTPFLLNPDGERVGIDYQQVPEEIVLPISSWQHWKNRWLESARNKIGLAGKLGVSFISGSATASNAFAGATNHQPKDLNGELWRSFSSKEKALSVINGVSSLIVNMLFTFFFMKSGYNFARRLLKKPKNNAQLLRNIFVVIIGIATAIAATSIAFNAMSWTQMPGLIFTLSGISFINYLFSRFSGAKNFINLIRDGLDKDIRNIKHAADELLDLDPNFLLTINQILKTSYNAHGVVRQTNEQDRGFNLLDEASLNYLMIDVFDQINQRLHLNPQVVKDKSGFDVVVDNSGGMFDLALSSFVAIQVFPTFTQKGFDGINILTGNSLDSADNSTKAMLGVLQGAGSSMLYFYSSFRVRRLVSDMVQELKRHPAAVEFLLFMLILGMNYFASESPANVADGVRQNENGIFNSFLAKEGMFFVFANQLGGFIANINPSMLIFQNFIDSRKKEPVREVYEFTKELKDFNTDRKPSATALEKIGLFNQRLATIRQDREPNSADYHRLDRNYPGIN